MLATGEQLGCWISVYTRWSSTGENGGQVPFSHPVAIDFRVGLKAKARCLSPFSTATQGACPTYRAAYFFSYSFRGFSTVNERSFNAVTLMKFPWPTSSRFAIRASEVLVSPLSIWKWSCQMSWRSGDFQSVRQPCALPPLRGPLFCTATCGCMP